MALRTDSIAKPAAARRSVSTCTLTAGRCPPAMLTIPTPFTWDRRCVMRFSTRSWTWVMGKAGELTASVMMGASAGLTFR